MNISPEEIGYFITQVGLAASSFGVSKEDITAVGESLGKTFGYRCAPPAVVVPSQGAHTQSICQAETCPLSPTNAMCSAYDDESVEPLVVNATLAMGQGRTANDSDTMTATATATGTGSSSGSGSGASAMPSQTGSNAASMMGLSFPPLVLALALALGL